MADLISRNLVKEIFSVEDKQQAQVDLLINWISEKAVSIIGRDIMSETRTTYLEGLGTDKIILPVIPITTMTSITLDSSHLFTGSALATTDYYLDTATGIVTLYNSNTPVGVNTIKIVYIAGYTEATLPADMKMACLEAIEWNLSRLVDKQFGIRNETTPDGVSRAYEMVLPLGVQRVFEAYKDVRV